MTGSYSGFERGTSGQPFNRVVEGVFAVVAGHNVHVAAGSYNEQVILDKPMTLNAYNGTVVVGQ